MYPKLFLMLAIGTVVWAACKKEAPQPSRTELLTSGLWKIDKARVEPSVALIDNQGNVTSYTSNFWWVASDSCGKNADFAFATDSTYWTNYNSYCPNYSNSGRRFWKWIDNEERIEFSDFWGNSDTFKVELLTKEEFVYSTSQQFRNQTHKILIYHRRLD